MPADEGGGTAIAPMHPAHLPQAPVSKAGMHGPAIGTGLEHRPAERL